MKRLLLVAGILFLSLNTWATLVLNPGDLVFISYSRSSSGYSGFFTLLSRVPIPAGTKIVLSNNYYSTVSGVQTFSTTTGSYTSPGEISITFNEPVSVGQAFQVIFNSTSKTSTIGSVSTYLELDFGDASDRSVVWLYEDDGSAKKAITGLMWNAGSGNTKYTNIHGTPPGIVWNNDGTNTNASGITALNLQISGNSSKCGSWNPYTSNTAGAAYKSAINLNDDISTTFYNLTGSNWVFNSSNVINTCSSSDVLDKVVTGYLDTYLSFDKYRYGFVANTWEQYNGSTWSTMTSPASPDWSTTTRSKEVYIYQNLTLGTFNSSSPSSTLFESAKLFIVDEKNDGVTLTVEAGHRLLINYSVSMSENSPHIGANPPKIYLKSNISTSNIVYHAQIEPSAAILNGTYKVEKYIQDPEWHHFISPIKTKLNQVGFSLPIGNNKNQFYFNYTGTTGFKNIYYWDADNANEVFWQPVGSTGDDYFSAKPYTIYFDPSEVPTIMTVEGPMALKDQDSVKIETVKYKSVSQGTTSPGQGAPSWTTTQLEGWNFYGNPYLSYMSTNQLMSNFSGSGKSMSGLAGSVYVWDPNYGGVNHSSNYIVNTGSENNGSLYIEPFQAFFMYTTSGSGNSNGFVKSKKYRITTPTVATVTNKTTSSVSEIAFEFRTSQSANPLKIYIHPTQIGSSIHKDPYKDAVFSGSDDARFFIVSDSSRYAIKNIPKNFSSITLPISAHTPTTNFHTISASPFIDDHYIYILKDLKTGLVHNLENSYTFQNDPNFIGNRFELTILTNQSFDILEKELSNSWISSEVTPRFFSKNDLKITQCFSISGELISEELVANGNDIRYLADQPNGIYLFALSNGEMIKFLKQ